MMYVLIGLIAGIISGMGIGGGAILIPSLTIFMGMGQQNAQHINLLYFIPTAVLAICVHRKNGNIEKTNLKPLILFGLLGALPGAIIAVNIDANYLRKGFAVFMLIMAAYEIRKGVLLWKDRNKTKNERKKKEVQDG